MIGGSMSNEEENKKISEYLDSIGEPLIPASVAIRIACETIDDFEVEDGYKIKRQIANRIKDYNIFQF